MLQKSGSKALAKTDEKPAPFEWTMPRRKALKLYLRGAFITDIADQVGVSRMTIQRWLKEPAFMEKVYQRVGERQTSNALRQQHFTSNMTNAVMDRYETAMKRFAKVQNNPKKLRRYWDAQLIALEQIEKLSKEFERMRNQMRLDSGQATHVSKHTSVTMHGGKVQHEHSHEHAVSFRAAMENYRNEIVINPADSAPKQLLESTVQVLQNTNFLEDRAAAEGDNAEGGKD